MISRFFVTAAGLLFSLALTASDASAGVADCKRIEAPLDRLACYDKLTGAKQPQPAKPALSRAAEPAGAVAYVKALPPVEPPGKAWWVESELAFYGLSRGHASPLIVSGSPFVATTVTTSPIPTAPGFIGLRTEQSSISPFLANQGTLYGGGGLDTRLHVGESLRFGRWLDPEHNQALEGGGFYVGRGSSNFASTGANGVGIPFVDANGNGQLFTVNRPTTTAKTSVFVNTTPATFVHLFDTVSTDQATGIASASYSNSLWGADLNYRLRTPLFRERGVNVDVSMGVKYLNLSETLSLSTASTATHSDATTYEPALGLPGTPNFTNSSTTTTATNDVIKTRNNFIGPQFGVRGDFRLDDRWSVSGDAKIAIGANIESLSVSGSTGSTATSTVTPTSVILLAGIPITTATGAPPVTTTTTTTSGTGIFASAANSGSHTRTVFAVIPTGTLKLNYDVIPNFLTLSLGYNAFWVSDVLRASNQLAGVGSPTYSQSSLLAQGVTVGARLKF